MGDEEMTILSILNELAETPSINEKVKILEREKDNDLLKRVFQAAYNPMINYYIKQIPDYITSGTQTIEYGLDFLKGLQSRSITGNIAIQRLMETLCEMNNDDALVLERILQRDLRCGTSDTLAARVWPGLVPTFDVMLAHKDISSIKFPCYGQVKYDGARAHLYWDGEHVTAFARSGKEFHLHNTFDKTFKDLKIPPNTTLDGELLVMVNGKFAERKLGNGALNKANKGTITKEESDSVIFMCWDKVDYTGKIPYTVRLDEITSLLSSKSKKIFVVDNLIITNLEEAQGYFEKCIKHGYEGAMMKNMDNTWEPKRVKSIGKMKAEECAELVVVDFVEGTGKYLGMLGSIIGQTSDGLLEVSVGTGFSDQERGDLWGNRLALKGQIFSVIYNQKITSKGKDTASLFLPRWDGFRFDKKVANNIGELK